jgi:FkbM family methyltransferase
VNLEELNLNPKFTKHLVKNKAFGNKLLVVADIGARGGFQPQWDVFGDQIRIIGFEPDQKECLSLNATQSNKGRYCFYPVALFNDSLTHPFYITEYPDSSGMYPPDPEILGRFPNEKQLTVKSVSQIKTIDFDSFSSSNNIGNVDFIKLDTEGAEYDILEGALKSIRKSVIGISCEAWFGPWHKNQKVFGDIDCLLRSLGFSLYDISLNRQARKSLPELRSAVMPTPDKYGQLIWCDALYLRDAVSEISSKKNVEDLWDQTKILKLVSLFELFRLPDCAIELLQYAQERNILRYSKEEMETSCDLLARGFTRYSYRRHVSAYKKIERRGYVNMIQRALISLKKSEFLKKLYFRMVPCLAKTPFFRSIHDFLKR